MIVDLALDLLHSEGRTQRATVQRRGRLSKGAADARMCAFSDAAGAARVAFRTEWRIG